MFRFSVGKTVVFIQKEKVSSEITMQWRIYMDKFWSPPPYRPNFVLFLHFLGKFCQIICASLPFGSTPAVCSRFSFFYLTSTGNRSKLPPTPKKLFRNTNWKCPRIEQLCALSLYGVSRAKRRCLGVI